MSAKQSSGDKNRRLVELIALLLLLCDEDTKSLASGQINSQTWAARIQDSLSGAHATAAALGRSAALGHPQAVSDADKIIGHAVAAGDAVFLRQFREDIDTGRYIGDEGALNERAVDARLVLYGNKLRATANRAFAEASEPGGLYEWLLDDMAHHCSGDGGMNCPSIAEGSPYTLDSLPTWPGAGETPCGTNCRCSVMRVGDGYAPFEEPAREPKAVEPYDVIRFGDCAEFYDGQPRDEKGRFAPGKMGDSLPSDVRQAVQTLIDRSPRKSTLAERYSKPFPEVEVYEPEGFEENEGERHIAELVAQNGHTVVLRAHENIPDQKEWDAFVRFGDKFEDTEFKSITDGAVTLFNTAGHAVSTGKHQAPNVVIYYARSDAEANLGSVILGIMNMVRQDNKRIDPTTNERSPLINRVYLLKSDGHLEPVP